MTKHLDQRNQNERVRHPLGFASVVAGIALLLVAVIALCNLQSDIHHLSSAARILSEATSGDPNSVPVEVSLALKLTNGSKEGESSLAVLGDILDAQNAVCSHFGDRAIYAMYAGLVTCAFIAYLVLRKGRGADVKVPIIDAEVPPRVALVVLHGAVVWMWIFFGYNLGSALTAKARSVSIAAAIDALRCAKVTASDKTHLYDFSAVHATERGEVVDILFASTEPRVWNVPLGGRYQHVASFPLFILTYAMALGLMHAAAALSLRELGRGAGVAWKLSASVLGVITVLALVGTHSHFALEFPELEVHQLSTVVWGVVFAVMINIGVVTMARRTQGESCRGDSGAQALAAS